MLTFSSALSYIKTLISKKLFLVLTTTLSTWANTYFFSLSSLANNFDTSVFNLFIVWFFLYNQVKHSKKIMKLLSCSIFFFGLNIQSYLIRFWHFFSEQWNELVIVYLRYLTRYKMPGFMTLFHWSSDFAYNLSWANPTPTNGSKYESIMHNIFCKQLASVNGN